MGTVVDSQNKYVVILLHDPSVVDHVSGTTSGGGALMSRPMSLQDARDHAQMRRDAQPSFGGKFIVCKTHEEF